MGFESSTLGFNEPTLTSAAYVCYLLSFLFYTIHLLTRSGRAVRVATGQVALAGAGSGGTVDIPLNTTTTGSSDNSQLATRNSQLGWLGFGFVALAWVFLTTALGIRWVEAGHP